MNLVEQVILKIEEAQLWHRELTLERNALLKEAGTIDTHLYYIVSGSIRIYFEDDYDEQILRLGYSGEIIGALDSYFSEQASNVAIQAIKKCQLKVVTKSAFEDLLALPENQALRIKLLEGMVYQLIEREKDVLVFSPKKRYERVLQRSPRLFQEIPAKYIASYLRMSPETLSRLKKS